MSFKFLNETVLGLQPKKTDHELLLECITESAKADIYLEMFIESPNNSKFERFVEAVKKFFKKIVAFFKKLFGISTNVPAKVKKDLDEALNKDAKKVDDAYTKYGKIPDDLDVNIRTDTSLVLDEYKKNLESKIENDDDKKIFNEIVKKINDIQLIFIKSKLHDIKSYSNGWIFELGVRDFTLSDRLPNICNSIKNIIEDREPLSTNIKTILDDFKEKYSEDKYFILVPFKLFVEANLFASTYRIPEYSEKFLETLEKHISEEPIYQNVVNYLNNFVKYISEENIKIKEYLKDIK